MKTLLVPTDFSVNAVNAMKYAIQLAQWIDAKLVFFHSTNIPLSVDLYGASKMELAKRSKQNEEEKTRQLRDLLSKLFANLEIPFDKVNVVSIVESGTLIVEDIIAAARKYKADMIVTGTHGATGINKLFGSNTSILISKSNVPVLAIPPKYRFRKLKNILYATDLKNPMGELKKIIPLAAAFDAAIDVFNLSYTAGLHEEQLFRKMTDASKYESLRFVQLKRNPGETVLQQLREFLAYRKPDLAVMFHEKKSFFEGLFAGNKTEELSYDLKGPLLSIRKK